MKLNNLIEKNKNEDNTIQMNEWMPLLELLSEPNSQNSYYLTFSQSALVSQVTVAELLSATTVTFSMTQL